MRSLHLRLAKEFVKSSSTMCRMLVFSGAALPSLHFHEKDPGSAQFLRSQLCKQIPGSTLTEASVSLLPPPVIHQDSTAPDSTCRPDTPQDGQWLYSTPATLWHLPCARHSAGLWMGPLAVYLIRVGDRFEEFTPPNTTCVSG